MKSIVFAFAVLTAATATYAQVPTESLEARMHAMSTLLEDAFSNMDRRETRPQAGDALREMRTHLIFAMNLKPAKIERMTGHARNLEWIQYHQATSRMVYLAARLEDALTNEDYEIEGYSREGDIMNLREEMKDLARLAHEKWRN